jgi:hypothetical protein
MVITVLKNKHYLLKELYTTHEYTVWEKFKGLFKLKAYGTYSYHPALEGLTLTTFHVAK